jgi:hypothetical protein
MQIDEDFQAMIPRPADSSIEVFRLTLDVRLPTGNIVCPETDG